MSQFAPKHLQPETRKWYRWVCGEWQLGQHHERILLVACESWDRKNQARLVIDDLGLTYLDASDQPKVRPEVAVERDSRLAFLRALRELDLDLDPPTQPGRPRALKSNEG